jgi:hypothetical protein
VLALGTLLSNQLMVEKDNATISVRDVIILPTTEGMVFAKK